MQTFSYLRRDSSHQNNITLIALFVLGVVYEAFISIYPIFSPFFGIIFLYTFRVEESKNNLLKFLFYLFIIIYEADKDFIIFSYFFFFFFSKRYIIFWLENYISSHIIKNIFFIIYSYLGYFLINFLFSFVFGTFSPNIGIEYLYFILTDIILSLTFFYAK